MADLYNEDILLWSERQGDLLRRVVAGEAPVEAPDWDNIIGEIEHLGRDRLAEVRCLLREALTHRLYAEAWPDSREVLRWRVESQRRCQDAREAFVPSMRYRIDMAALYAQARQAVPDAQFGRPGLPLSVACPVTLDALLGL